MASTQKLQFWVLPAKKARYPVQFKSASYLRGALKWFFNLKHPNSKKYEKNDWTFSFLQPFDNNCHYEKHKSLLAKDY